MYEMQIFIMKIIAAIQILIKLFTIGYGAGASPWLGGSPHPRGGQLVGPVVTDGT